MFGMKTRSRKQSQPSLSSSTAGGRWTCLSFLLELHATLYDTVKSEMAETTNKRLWLLYWGSQLEPNCRQNPTVGNSGRLKWGYYAKRRRQRERYLQLINVVIFLATSGNLYSIRNAHIYSSLSLSVYTLACNLAGPCICMPLTLLLLESYRFPASLAYWHAQAR